MVSPTLFFDFGTVYDLFVSLVVLHDPGRFGLRPAWAAGMRSRLPGSDREFFEKLNKSDMLHPSLQWQYELPTPKDAGTALRVLAAMPPEDRLPAMADDSEEPHAGFKAILERVRERGAWNEKDKSALEGAIRAKYETHAKGETPKLDGVPIVLDWWADLAGFGEQSLAALTSYYEVFFAEEERRIAPALNAAVEHAQELSETMAFDDLFEELSQGVRLEDAMAPEIIFAPSYWSTPLIFWGKIAKDRMLFLFGARPDTDSLVPGEAVPDALVRALKALSDPTRLRILRYLEKEQLTPSQLARRLRLRPPTVLHHLNALRMAGLVQVHLSESGEKTYAARSRAIEAGYKSLRGFLQSDGEE